MQYTIYYHNLSQAEKSNFHKLFFSLTFNVIQDWFLYFELPNMISTMYICTLCKSLLSIHIPKYLYDDTLSMDLPSDVKITSTWEDYEAKFKFDRAVCNDLKYNLKLLHYYGQSISIK